MLRIFDEVLVWVRLLRPVLEVLEGRDRALADQVRRASQSVGLNLCEGSGVRGGNRRVHYERAHGSVREVMAGLMLAEAAGVLDGFDPQLLAIGDHIAAVTYKLQRR